MKKIFMIMLAGIIIAMATFTGCSSDNGATDNGGTTEEKPTLKLSDLNWGSAHFQSEMAKIMIEKGYGYPVELVPGATIPLTQALRSGDIDILLEGWYQNQKEAIDAGLDAGEIEMIGYLNDDNWQSGFVVPTFVIKGDAERGIEAMAPDLKAASDLSDPAYMELFANPENKSKGLLVNGPPGWSAEIKVPEQAAAYGLADDYDIINAGSSEGLFASLKSAYDKGEPWLGYLWGPTWIAGALDLTVLEEPAYTPELWEQGACAFPSVDLFVAGHIGFTEKAPDVADMFSKWKLDTATLNTVLAYMNDTGGEPIDAAVWFLKNSEDIWTKFVPSDVAAKIKAAVADM